MTDLDKLIEAVEAGEDAPEVFDLIVVVAEGRLNATSAYEAFLGSLDAAKALHEALLPGWLWSVDDWRGAYVLHKDGYRAGHARAKNNTCARAWLLAILKAWRAQQ